jgi:hypothetical protein
MRLYYVSDSIPKRHMVADVPDDIGPCIGIGARGPSGAWITSVDEDARIYRCEDGTQYTFPERYRWMDHASDPPALVAEPSRERFPFREEETQ